MSANSENGAGAIPFAFTRGDLGQDALAPQGLSVLLVDDTTAYQKVIHSLLIRRGHHVAIANHGGEALSLFLHGNFDVVIMDIHMPVMNGYEAALAIREHEVVGETHIPIIAITTQAEAVSQAKCFAAGIDAYLLKPIDVAQLFELVENLGEHGHVLGPAQPPPLSNDKEKVNPQTIIDVAGSVKRLGGDMELFKEIVHIFDEDSPAIIRSLREAVERRDGTNVERFAHSLKGLTANFGAKRTVDAAGRLEDIGRKCNWQEVQVATEQLLTEVTRLSGHLNQFRTNN